MSSNTPKADGFDSRWPRDEDRLFVESAWTYDAHIVRDPAERFYRMPMGYKRSGDILIDQASADMVDRANVIYAALFCYRQSIELFLKRSGRGFWQWKGVFAGEYSRAQPTVGEIHVHTQRARES